MAIAAGIKGFVGHATESVWSTPVAASGYNRYQSQSFIDNADLTDGNKNLGKLFAGGKRIYRKRAEGDIKFSHRYQGLERWLYHLFGTVATSTFETTGKKHIFTLNATRLPGLSVEFHSDVNKFVIPGVKLNRLTLDVGVGVADLTFAGTGKRNVSPPGTVEASPTFLEDVAGTADINSLEPAPLGGPGVINNGFSFQIGVGGTFATPTTVKIAEPARIDIDIPLDTAILNLGDPDIQEPIVNGLATVGGEVNRYYIDDDIVEYWAAGNPLYFRFQYDAAAVVATQPYSLRVDIPYALISSAMPAVNAAGALKERVPFVAATPTGTPADAIAYTLWNKLATVD